MAIRDFRSEALQDQRLRNIEENAVDLSDEAGTTVEENAVSDALSDLSDTNTLYLDNTYDSNNLISVFDSRWASAISIGILNAETANEGISPSKYVINVDGQQNDLIYGEPTSELITRPYFLLTSDESEASILYSDEEKTALQTTYEKQDISDSIKEKVSSMSSTILAKMNLNIEQNLSFQKTKTKALKFKNTSIFEEAPEVNESPATTSTTLSTTSGNY
jgi:hypothetical protein